MPSEKVYIGRNYRPNTQLYRYPGSIDPHESQVLTDLYDPDTGKFCKTVIIAKCFDVGEARRWAAEANAERAKKDQEQAAAQAPPNPPEE